MMTDRELVQIAMDMRSRGYAPYSGFRVGAALLCRDGEVYKGCNVENSSFGATICAERSAAVAAVSGGNLDFEKLAVAGSGKEYCVPCGICRQFLHDLAKDMVFLCADSEGNYKEYRFDELLPNAFEL